MPADKRARRPGAARSGASGGAGGANARPGALGATRDASARGAALLGVAITHPDKPLWPDAGDGVPVTKLDLAQYFVAMADAILPHIAGRPCSVVRAPDGLKGARFFQRHVAPGASVFFTRVALGGANKPYLQIDRAEALVAAAQSGALELHPWNCRAGAPDEPGRLVFDLDPGPGVAFDGVVRAAREVQARLRAYDLEAFCKTTGGKGLHVVAPLARPAGVPFAWRQAKSFARALCIDMAADAPALYVATMSKARRGGRIFLDYLRNDYMATAVAPLSPRARPGAPVAMPVSWTQVRAGLDPARFTLRTAPTLLVRRDPWAGYADAARPLSTAALRRAATAQDADA